MMKTTTQVSSPSQGRRMTPLARTLAAVIALAALAMPNHSSAQAANPSTQTLTILGGNGTSGSMAANVEYYNPAKGLWQPTYLTGSHPWGYVSGTNSWINYKTSNASDPGAGANGTNSTFWYLYRVRFTVPADAIDPKMKFSLKADNFAQVAINGVTVGGSTRYINNAYMNNVIEGAADQVNADAVFSQNVRPGENTITLNIGDHGGLNGFNFRIDLSMQSSQPLEIVPAQLPVNWVNWTGSETTNNITRYVGQITVPRAGGGVTAITVKYTPPTQQYGVNWDGKGYWRGICFAQFSNGADYFAQVSGGVKLRNLARSPYTSAKVQNIPDGGGASSDMGDIIALQFGGTNQLDFYDASTGQPIAIASPVFAYVSLNGNGYGFDKDFDILSFGDGTTRDMGFWGAGTSHKSTTTVNGVPQYQLLGTGEPHGTLQFRGAFSTVKWQSLSNETWNGFTIGVAQVAADVPIANAGPDQTVTASSSSGASVQLSGSVSGSTNAPFTYSWTGAFGAASGQNPTVTLPVGTNTVSLKVTDAAGRADTDTVVVTVLPVPPDTTKPVITSPGDIMVEASSAAGATVFFSASATDNKDGNVPVTASPASGSVFPLGITAVGLAASDAAGNTATAEFDVSVVDTTAPVLSVPADVSAEATGAAGAVVGYPSATATDAVGVTSITYSQASGSQFPLGTTSVSVTARDAANNASSRSFQVTVGDTTAPVISAPADIVAEATSAAGAVVSYSASASDLVDGSVAVSGSPASGSVFPLGATSVALSASDSRGNSSSTSFSVTVVDTTAPALTVPASQTIEATSAAGAVANFAASATDAVGVTSLTYSAASGSTFAIGTTTVTVSASDAAGNVSSGSFTVTVVDTTAPDLSVPANQVLEATSAAGAVANFAASATDAVGVTSLTYSAASGSTFAIGTTTVTVTAKDAVGNTTSGSFTVTVVDTTAPVITAVAPSIREIWPPNKKMVPVSVTVASSDAVGVASTRIVSVTTNQPDRRTQWQITGPLTVNLLADREGDKQSRIYTITIEVRDAAGNVSTVTTTVIVPHDQRHKKDDDKDDDKKDSDKKDSDKKDSEKKDSDKKDSDKKDSDKKGKKS